MSATGCRTDSGRTDYAAVTAANYLYLTSLQAPLLSAPVSAGATSCTFDITVASADEIVFDAGQSTEETMTVDTVAGSGLIPTFTTPFAFAHVLTGPNQGHQSHCPRTSSTVHELAVTARVSAAWGAQSPAGVLTTAAGPITEPAGAWVGATAAFTAITAGTYKDSLAEVPTHFAASGPFQPIWTESAV